MTPTLLATAAQILIPYVLTIPDYQRGYAWEREHVHDFLTDLELLDPAAQHYTGTLVLLGTGTNMLIDDDSRPLAQLDIVDGQQRITTVCLFLNEIRRALADLGQQSAADGIVTNYLLYKKGGQAHPKLQLADGAKQIWSALLQGQAVDAPETVSGRRLLDAVKQIRAYVSAIVTGDDPIGHLQRFRDALITRLQFTIYRLDEQAEVGVIFETLNDRGKPLTELEKVKNYLLFLAARLPAGQRQHLATRINHCWARIYRLLLEVAKVSAAEEDQFLRAHWLAAVNPVSVHWRGIKSVKARYARTRYAGAPDLMVAEVGGYVDSLARARI